MLTLTSGPAARADAAWMACASNSLPVPVSPSSSTGLDDSAARRAWRLTSTAAGAAAHEAGQRVLGAALARQLAPGVVQVALQVRELADQRLQRGFGMVEQHDADRADQLAALVVAQRNAADDEGAGAVGEQVDQDRLAGFQHAAHLRVRHHVLDHVAHHLVDRRKAQRRQEALVAFVEPDDAAGAVHQEHALADAGEQLEHRARGQLQDALAVARQG